MRCLSAPSSWWCTVKLLTSTTLPRGHPVPRLPPLLPVLSGPHHPLLTYLQSRSKTCCCSGPVLGLTVLCGHCAPRRLSVRFSCWMGGWAGGLSTPGQWAGFTCFTQLGTSFTTAKPTACGYLGCSKISLIFSTIHSFFESLLFISTTGRSYSSAKYVKPF